MARRNISLPDDLDEAARVAGINVSALTRQAIETELDRRARRTRLGAWLDELDEQHGPPTDAEMAEARAWFDDRSAVADQAPKTAAS
jgi:post-segregation antitoxin (ccd killing protein)